MGFRTVLFSAALFVLAPAQPAFAVFDSGSTGADGPFNPIANTVIDLSQADTGPGTGHYDAVHWAVVFNYTTIDIPAGVSVTFTNHQSGAPVVWLASGDVTIAGEIMLSGAIGTRTGSLYSEPGPGGFAGGPSTRRFLLARRVSVPAGHSGPAPPVRAVAMERRVVTTAAVQVAERLTATRRSCLYWGALEVREDF
jgi:hypothetical protein